MWPRAGSNSEIVTSKQAIVPAASKETFAIPVAASSDATTLKGSTV
jgi:hypothetical protein